MIRRSMNPATLCLVLAAGLAAAAWERPAVADGMYFPPIEVVESGGDATDMDSQLAIIKVYETGTWDLIIRPRLTGDPSHFAWVVPFPVRPVVNPDPVDENFFKNLDDLTTTTFIEESCESYCDSSSGVGCGGMAGDSNKGEDIDTRRVEVLESGQVGIFEYAVLSSTDGESLMAWLAENGFYVSTKAGPIIDELALEGHTFFAAKITIDDSQIRNVSGVSFSLPASVAPFYPMRLTAAAGTDRVGVTLWVLDEAGRSWIPSNYPWEVIEGDGPLGDEMQQPAYESMEDEIFSAGTGNSFIIQYATDSAQSLDCTDFHGYYVYPYLASAACQENWFPSAEMSRVLDWGKTRMHAEIPPASLTRDVELQIAAEGELARVVAWYWWPCRSGTDPDVECAEERFSYNCSAAAARGPGGAGAILFLILVLSAAATLLAARRFFRKGGPKH